MPKGGGRRHLGKPYEVAGNWFHPKHDPHYDKTGVASWYGPKFNRRMTSNGEWFDMDQLTAAHTTMELPSYALVTNLENGREVVVRVNDRGPFVNDRIIDLSRLSADKLGFRRKGRAKVRVKYLGPAPIEDSDYGHLAAMNDELIRGTPPGQMIAGANLRNGRYGDAAPQQTASVSGQASTYQPVSSSVPAAGGAGYMVQVAAFSEPTNAERTRNALADLGGVSIQPASTSYGTLYRVRLGPWQDQATANAALLQVRARGHHDAYVKCTC
jgi:rare lipoprotein A